MKKTLATFSLLAALAIPAMAEPLTLDNGKVSATWDFANGHLTPGAVTDKTSDATQKLGANLFELVVSGKTIKSSDLVVSEKPQIESLTAKPDASRYSDRIAGKEIVAKFTNSDHTLSVTWRAILRDGSRYLRETVDVTATGKDLPLQKIVLLDLAAPGAKTDGVVSGSPVVTANEFLGVEHPMAYNHVDADKVLGELPEGSSLTANDTANASAVIGFFDKGQMRRDFLAYIERERAHPYRTFLNYNTWYDIGYFTPYTAADVINRINAFGTELVQKRGVKMDSLLMDDGWDNPKTLWQFNSGFPDGLTNVQAAAHKYGFSVGMWLSPWGGYGHPKQERIKFGKAAGYKIVDGSFSMSDPKYFATFAGLCTSVVKKYGVNQFKFDGIGEGDDSNPNALGAGKGMRDFEAMLRLIGQLRALEPNIYINQTTGTWPSPFWLMAADSIWRGGGDNGFADKEAVSKDDPDWANAQKFIGHFGDAREQWITYRDGDVYKSVVSRGPLYPINSLMLHGIVMAQMIKNGGYKALASDPGHDLKNEIRSFFGTGTQMQELYITPSLLSKQNWDDIAASAKWSRANAQTLKDTHWIGGDPSMDEVYGWAAWSPEKGIITLRNPSDKDANISIDAAKVFELPTDAAKSYTLVSPYPDQPVGAVTSLEAGKPATFHLKPFQVLVLEAHPQK